MLETLKEVFGFREFRPNQEAIIQGIMAKRDVFAVMPTGGGKSLCYQLPARMTRQTAVVISPLISLMKDQVDAARLNGLRAAFLNSSLSGAEKAGVLRRLRNRELELLYLAPERLNLAGFLESLRGVPLALFAVDEAHCVSEWGHDFRPDYLTLSQIKEQFPQTPLAAFTATATPQVQEDIIARLKLREPLVIRASFDRPNFFLEVRRKEAADTQILQFLRARQGQTGIIYRTTRDSVEKTATFLRKRGINVRPYHAGLPDDERRANQEAFRRDEVEVVVATIAFGMGIDKPNVRFVIHADLPKSLEGYYQEIGRAGRDGEPAHCLLLYSHGDAPRLFRFIDQIESEAERQAATQRLERMIGYAESAACRRRSLLAYFGEALPAGSCKGCDVCAGHQPPAISTAKVVTDATADDTASVASGDTVDAQMILSAMYRTGQRFGAKHIVEVVAGANTARIRDFHHDRLPTYGVGKHKPRKHWDRVIGELLVQRVIVREGDEYPILKLTSLAGEVLKGQRPFTMKVEAPPPVVKSVPTKGARRQRGKKADHPPREPLRNEDRGLFERLRALRLRLAEEHGIPPYLIFHNRTLQEMCEQQPTTFAEMAEISGVGEAKLTSYGKVFMDEIESYLAETSG